VGWFNHWARANTGAAVSAIRIQTLWRRIAVLIFNIYLNAAPYLLFSAGDVHFGSTGHDVEKLLISSLADHEGKSRRPMVSRDYSPHPALGLPRANEISHILSRQKYQEFGNVGDLYYGYYDDELLSP
jgi:hypothetical protein